MLKVKLGNIAEIKTGKLNSNEAVDDGKYPFFTTAPETLRINKFSFDQTAVLLGGNNAKGNYTIKRYNGKFDAYQRTYIINSLEPSKVSNELIYYSIKLGLELLKESSAGSATKFLTKSIVEHFKVPFNVNKIADILSALDDKIELNRKVNSELEKLARTIYDYWFLQFDFPNANGAPYRTSGGVMTYSKVLKREIPDGWEVKKLSDVADTGSGGTPLSSKKEYYENGNIPWINSTELNSGYIVNAKKFITEIGMNNSSAKLFPTNSLLIALYGATAGKVSLLSISATTNQAVCAVMPKNSFYLYYIQLYLQDLYNYFIQMSTGSARDNLSQEMIRNLQLVTPPKEILTQFDKQVKPIFQKIQQNNQQSRELAELRDWLLPMLMNGQISV